MSWFNVSLEIPISLSGLLIDDATVPLIVERETQLGVTPARITTSSVQRIDSLTGVADAVRISNIC